MTPLILLLTQPNLTSTNTTTSTYNSATITTASNTSTWTSIFTSTSTSTANFIILLTLSLPQPKCLPLTLELHLPMPLLVPLPLPIPSAWYRSKIDIPVGTNSLVVTAPTYSATALTATRVRFPSWSPLLILSPSLSTQCFPVSSLLSCPDKGRKPP